MTVTVLSQSIVPELRIKPRLNWHWLFTSMSRSLGIKYRLLEQVKSLVVEGLSTLS
jgi:hypothetical protein